MPAQPPTRYTRTAIGLHWLMALGLGGSFALGLYMTELPFSPTKLQLFSWHKWAGVTLFLLAGLRVVWRLIHGAPATPAGMPVWQAKLAEWTHRLLYLLMIAIPLSGWLMSSAKGVQTVYFGLLPLPDLLERNPDLGRQLETLHTSSNYLLLALVIAHAAAALKHHLVDRDEVLPRMLPWLRRT